MQNITNGKPNLVIIDEIDGVSGKGSGDQVCNLIFLGIINSIIISIIIFCFLIYFNYLLKKYYIFM